MHLALSGNGGRFLCAFNALATCAKARENEVVMMNNYSQHHLAEEIAKQTRMIQQMQTQIEETNKKVKAVYNVVLALIIIIFFVPFIFGLIGGFLSAL